MKHIHIVEPYHSSSMEAMSRPLVDALAKLYRVTISTVPDPDADLNYHIPWHTLAGLEKGNGKHALLYTHCNPDMQARLLDACERADLIICMSFTGRRELLARGVDPAKLWVIYPSIRDGIKTRRRTIGVFGSEQPNGRKRSHILLDLVWKMDCSPFHFVVSGSGWDDVVTKMRNAGAAVDCLESVNDEIAVYPYLDIFLVTGFIEGGPLPVLEALAAGVKVLSPRCGISADLLDEGSFYDDTADLIQKLQKLDHPVSYRSKLARVYTWENYVHEHALVFGRLLGESVELGPRNGASRYVQLLDIIDDCKPELIVEIGTWNGANAVRMIQEADKYGAVEYEGYDLFETMTVEQFCDEFSKWGWPEQIVEKRISAAGSCYSLLVGDTKKTLRDYSATTALFFIDGGHSEQTIQSDWSHISFSVRLGSTAVFDDYYHANKPRGMGCNTIIDGLDRSMFTVEHLPARTTNDDGVEIGMVKVTHAHLPVC